MQQQHARPPRSAFWLLLCLIASLTCACDSVEFYAKERLSNPLMAFDSDPLETGFYQKVFYSREGSIGGIGVGGGGGCGCGN